MGLSRQFKQLDIRLLTVAFFLFTVSPPLAQKIYPLCSESNTAASAKLTYESEGYRDWYLPSYDELIKMYNTIGHGTSVFTSYDFSVSGCIDPNAINFDPSSTYQAVDENRNKYCTYDSCDDVPVSGCIYQDSFGIFAHGFGASECSGYGGIACENISSEFNIGAFTYGTYWSSSEDSHSGAYYVAYGELNSGYTDKNSYLKVRPIRSF